ncbi:hypothetical protein ID866_12191 [Astraeus odoratus]|nr:hypothetical protein ID866_12191 [Astraeus odoratus]
MSWAADRKGSQLEDRAYALAGLFGVYIAVKYEEEERASNRLQVAILKEYNDHSIFAWSPRQRTGHGSVLANYPSDFRDCNDLLRQDPSAAFINVCLDAKTNIEDHESFQVTSEKGIEIWLPVTGCFSIQKYHIQAKLACCRESGNGEPITLNLVAVSSTDDSLFFREFDPLFQTSVPKAFS